jgi:hypothetical protein
MTPEDSPEESCYLPGGQRFIPAEATPNVVFPTGTRRPTETGRLNCSEWWNDLISSVLLPIDERPAEDVAAMGATMVDRLSWYVAEHILLCDNSAPARG